MSVAQKRLPIDALALLALALLAPSHLSAEALRIPAFTAYSEPDPNGLTITEKVGVDGWKDARLRVVWHGRFEAIGKLEPTISLVLPQGETATLRLSVAGQQRTAKAVGAGEQAVDVVFDALDLAAAGYQSLVLEGVAKDGATFGRIAALRLDGPASVGAAFNLKPRRNAASVHLHYPLAKDAKVAAFYNEVTVRSEPVWSYYMACGFHRGYFGIQVNSATERRIIFSVWDSGKEGVDRGKVADDDRVKLLAKGDGVVASDFGNEGTGGHSHLVYPWTIGTTYRFLVTAKPDDTHTEFSGFFYFPERKRWELIASFRAPKDGGWLHGLYSFNEDFVGANGDLRRLAEFGNQWVRGADGAWSELLKAEFTCDATGKSDRVDRTAGLVDGRFFLANGGFVDPPLPMNTPLTRPALGKPPEDVPAVAQ